MDNVISLNLGFSHALEVWNKKFFDFVPKLIKEAWD